MAVLGIVTIRQIQRATVDARGQALQFDAVMSEQHGQRLQVTENPIETGVTISDHCYVEGATLSLVASISDIKMPSSASGYESPAGRSNYAYQRLVDIETQLAENRLAPFEIITSVKKYTNMVMTEINMTRDKTTPFLGRFTMNFKEIMMVSTALTDYIAERGAIRRAASPTKDGGKQQAKEPTSQETANAAPTKGALEWLTGKLGIT